MRDADRAIAELAEQGIVLDPQTEVDFRVAWEALPEVVKPVLVFVADDGSEIPIKPPQNLSGSAKRGPGRPRKNP